MTDVYFGAELASSSRLAVELMQLPRYLLVSTFLGGFPYMKMFDGVCEMFGVSCLSTSVTTIVGSASSALRAKYLPHIMLNWISKHLLNDVGKANAAESREARSTWSLRSGSSRQSVLSSINKTSIYSL